MNRRLRKRYGHMAPMRREGGFDYGFVVADCPEPPHVHVRHRESVAKVWLKTLEFVREPQNGADRNKMFAFVRDNQARLLREWEDFCGNRR